MSLRLIPNNLVFRPGDAVETAECWELALQSKDAPSVLALTRQGLAQYRTEKTGENMSAKGAYRVASAQASRKAVIFATGSEVNLALDAAKALEAKGIGVDVVSMPCWELFDAQDAAYKADILGGDDVLRVSIEAGCTLGWQKYTGNNGLNIGIDSFGASAPAGDLFAKYGLTTDQVVARIEAQL